MPEFKETFFREEPAEFAQILLEKSFRRWEPGQVLQVRMELVLVLDYRYPFRSSFQMCRMAFRSIFCQDDQKDIKLCLHVKSGKSRATGD